MARVPLWCHDGGVPWGVHVDETPSPDPALDPYRGAVARLLDHDRHAGHSITVVGTGWRLVGWAGWRPRWGAPHEQVEVLVAPEPEHKRRLLHRLVLGREWDGRTITVDGRRLVLEWIAGDEADRARERFRR